MQESKSFTGDDRLQPEKSSIRSRRNEIEEALFGVLYTLSKEKLAKKRWFAVFLVAADFVQLLMLLLTSSINWKVDESVEIFIDAVNEALDYVRPGTLFEILGYTAFIIGFLVIGLVLIVSLIISIFVRFTLFKSFSR
uniref:Uncharacterized protein n=1 Tax=Palpitomonas bilix TaxID=652834 RepID=A0A7S3G6L3_9EUKA|mmetsp:Transcript_3007/g.5840  ORF Transcript_3007/g.5840 Transcript_3007/m.5840 type:complete len:138 (+) Transcript_3007:136-549(+)